MGKNRQDAIGEQGIHIHMYKEHICERVLTWEERIRKVKLLGGTTMSCGSSGANCL